jgi:hypothetical protein
MNKILTYTIRYLVAIIFIASFFLAPAPQIAAAQSPDCKPGMGSANCSTAQPGQDLSSQASTAFTKYYSKTMKGGYVAKGVGMRDTGYGTIKISGISSGSTVVAAYLYWAIIGPSSMPGFNYAKGYINGAAITGKKVASSQSPCWADASGHYPPIWSYRADVKSKVNKAVNGAYSLSGFASGVTDGSDPWSSLVTLPLLEGASLVIIYSNNNMPSTSFLIYNGAATLAGGVDNAVRELHLDIPGVNAVAPTGFSSTTFIGSGAYNSPSPTSFFSQTVGSGWQGSDPNGYTSSYSGGNLWDTMTVDLHSLISPPESDFWFSSNLSFSCVTWVAQVLSYSSGKQDTDRDGLLDGWELNGYDANGDGIPEVNLPAMGANPLHKDLFVEADYMNDSTGTDFALPAEAQLDDVVNSFKNAPVANPDGTTGINLHIDTGGAAYGVAPGTIGAYNLGGGNLIPFQTNLGVAGVNCTNYDWSQFQALKNSNFRAARIPIFHYMIFAYDLASNCGTVSGISRNSAVDSVFIKGATDFIVSLGDWINHGASTEREGTFMHELGHNLGLRNGGNDQVNYKPNYLSVMNSFFETSGVWRDGSLHYDYSRFLLPSLNENSLKEPVGLGPLTTGDAYGTKWYCPDGTTVKYVYATGWLDWNCDTVEETSSVKVDLNHDLKYTTLGSQNNWASINFSGNGVIGSGASLSDLAGDVSAMSMTPNVDELTFEMNQQIHASDQSASPANNK